MICPDCRGKGKVREHVGSYKDESGCFVWVWSDEKPCPACLGSGVGYCCEGEGCDNLPG